MKQISSLAGALTAQRHPELLMIIRALNGANAAMINGCMVLAERFMLIPT